MVATHTVKINGKYYRAGEEIPVLGKPVVEEKVEEKPYTKTEINRMNSAELRDIASKNGIPDVDELTGTELKKILVEKFEL